jgi:outer membrane protein OmpA-like peptidoglycan-associated protein
VLPGPKPRMSTARPSALVVTIAVALVAGCGPKRVAQPTRPTPVTLIVLLPDPESGTTGRARVSDEFGSADLAAPRAATRVTADGPPGRVSTMSDADVKRLFGEALAALPPAPRHFTLHFRFESDALTEESTALVPEILRTVKGLSVPEVIVVGHTDTMGDPKANLALGRKRAISVSHILVKAGLAPSTIEVTSHGEGDLLVKTPDNTSEPRNRRVEITVR